MPRSCALAPASYLSLLLLVISGCSVDDRELRSASSGGSDAGPSSGAQAGTADVPDTSDGGSDAGPSSGQLVDGCADLDTDGIADCRATLAKNPTFNEDVSEWSPSSGAELVWAEMNALADLPSGSAKLSATAARASAAQCLGVQGARLVIAYANAFVEAETVLGQAELEVSFFDSEDCSGAASKTFETPRSSVTGAWTTIQAGGVSASTTTSASIALVVLKTDDAPPLDVYFDNVMIKAKAP